MTNICTYEGSPITFDNKNGKMMVNATEMAKPFGKRVNDWLNLTSTKEFLEILSDTRKNGITDFQAVMTVKGNFADGRTQGTWFHEDVALEFARWLSPKFAIWCNDQIKTLLKEGEVSLNVPKTFREALLLAAEQQRLIEEQQSKIIEDQPKVEFADALLSCKSSILIGEMAKILHQIGHKNMGQNRFFIWLRDNHYLMSNNRPYQKYIEQGIFSIKVSSFYAAGENRECITTKITPKGQQYFINLFKKAC